jgi:ABC-2 type transport system permease protein
MSVTMLADAVFSEAYRFTRNRIQVFLSVLLVPILFAIAGVAFHVLTKSKGDPMAAQAGLAGMTSLVPVNLADALTFGANHAANGILMVFMLVGAATVYAGDYRWETWRLISARNTRTSLILGKVGVVKLMALIASLAFIIAAFVFFIAQAVVYHRPVVFHVEGGDLGKFLLLWLLSYVRIVQYGLIALLAGVVTRSMMAAVFTPWALGFVQSILGLPPVMMILGLKPDGWPAQLLMPGLAYDTLKTAVVPMIVNVPFQTPPVTAAIVSLALWCFIPLIGAILLFKRQDLSKE